MPIVVLDTNILLQDPLLRGAHLAKLFIGCRRCGIAVYVPDVVCDELRGNYRQHIQRAARELEATVKTMVRLGVNYVAPELDVDKAERDYAVALQAAFEKFHVQRARYPDVSLQRLIRASYEGKKPFKSSGDGHKDYLIFSTLVALAEPANSPTFFITNNRKDFCDDRGELHPDLGATLAAGSAIEVYDSAARLYDEVLAPLLASLAPLDNPEAIVTAIRAGTFPGFDLADRLESLLIQALVNGVPDLDVVDTPLNDSSVTQLIGFDVRETNVSALDGDQVTIDVRGGVELELFGFMDKSDYYGAPDQLPISIDDGDWNDYVVSAYSTATADFAMTIVFDMRTHTATSVDVTLEP